MEDYKQLPERAKASIIAVVGLLTDAEKKPHPVAGSGIANRPLATHSREVATLASKVKMAINIPPLQHQVGNNPPLLHQEGYPTLLCNNKREGITTTPPPSSATTRGSAVSSTMTPPSATSRGSHHSNHTMRDATINQQQTLYSTSRVAHPKSKARKK